MMSKDPRYSGNRLSTQFSVKDKTKKEHSHNLVYEVKCPNQNCNSSYVGEIERRFIERIKDIHDKDQSSHVHKHSVNNKYEEVTIEDFKTLIFQQFQKY